VHSSYTEDQVEFGAPLLPTARLAKAIGLDAIAVTDHAYDLDDSLSCYMEKDAERRKWNNFLAETAEINSSPLPRSFIIPGQETTVNRLKGRRNIHLQVLGENSLLPGEADSGEKWFSFLKKQPALDEALKEISREALAVGAHIGEKPPFFHRLLLGRSSYSEEEILLPGIEAFQVLNGSRSRFNNRGLSLWKTALLNGKKAVPLAGSDSHGNFNIARYMLLPHFLLRAAAKQLLGEVRTLVAHEKENTAPAIKTLLSAVRKGKVQLSNGPVVNLHGEGSSETLFGEVLSRDGIRNGRYKISVRSTREFGAPEYLGVFCGRKNSREEITLLEEHISDGGMSLSLPADLKDVPEDAIYIRLETRTRKGAFSFSAPVYVE
jgi:hypothetical protein